MIHFELENFDVLTSILRSEKMSLKKNIATHTEFYSLVLRFFSQLLSKANTPAEKKIYTEFYTSVHKQAESSPPLKKSAQTCHDFLLWVKSKK